MDAVFVAEGKIIQQVFEGVNTALGEQFGALRPNTFDHLHIRLKVDAHHSLLYTILEVSAAFRETCAAAPGIDRVGVRHGFTREVALAEDRLTGADKRILVLWILCGIVGALFAQRYFFRAFPEASVDFKVSRAEAQSQAKQFVE